MNFLALRNDTQIGVAHAESLCFKSDVCTPTVSVASLGGRHSLAHVPPVQTAFSWQAGPGALQQGRSWAATIQ